MKKILTIALATLLIVACSNRTSVPAGATKDDIAFAMGAPLPSPLEGQPVEILHPGDVAKCPPGVKHWHGAAPNSRFAHLAANTNPDKPGVEWYDMLSKEEYETFPIK